MKPTKQPVCPWWLGYILLSPVRKIGHNPGKIIGPHIKEGMTVLDFGSAMGYFSLPMARMAGLKGRVYCVDIQEKMLQNLLKRAKKAGLDQTIKTRLVGKSYDPLEFQNKIDFAMLFAVAHEVTDQRMLFTDLFSMVQSGGKVLFAEPKGHVSREEFEKSLQLAVMAGFTISEEKPMPKGLSAFLLK